MQILFTTRYEVDVHVLVPEMMCHVLVRGHRRLDVAVVQRRERAAVHDVNSDTDVLCITALSQVPFSDRLLRMEIWICTFLRQTFKITFAELSFLARM